MTRPDAEQTADTHELLVCHGNVIRYCTLRALQLPPEAWLRLSHPNCGITMWVLLGARVVQDFTAQTI